MITLEDYLDSMLISIQDIQQRIQMEELSKEVQEQVCKEAREVDATLGMFRDKFFLQNEERD